MSKLDKQKEWIGVWKVSLFFLLGSEFTLIGFLFNNYDKMNEIKLVLLIVTLFILLIGIIVNAIYLKKEINKLEDIDE